MLGWQQGWAGSSLAQTMWQVFFLRKNIQVRISILPSKSIPSIFEAMKAQAGAAGGILAISAK